MLDIMVFNFSTKDCRLWRSKSCAGIFILNVRTATRPLDIAVTANTGGRAQHHWDILQFINLYFRFYILFFHYK